MPLACLEVEVQRLTAAEKALAKEVANLRERARRGRSVEINVDAPLREVKASACPSDPFIMLDCGSLRVGR